MDIIEAFDKLKEKIIKLDEQELSHIEELYLLRLVISYRDYVIFSEMPTIEKLSVISTKQSKYLLSLLKYIILLSKEFSIESKTIMKDLDKDCSTDPHNILRYMATNIKDENYPFVYEENKIVSIIKTIFKVIAKDDRVLKDIFLKYAYTKYK